MNLRLISKYLFILVILGIFLYRCRYGKFPNLFNPRQVSFAEKASASKLKYEELKQATVENPLILPEGKIEKETPLEEYEYDFSRMIFLFEQLNSVLKTKSFDPLKPLERDFLRWLQEECELEQDLFADYLGTQKRNRLSKSKVRSRRSLIYYRRALSNSLTKIKSLLAQKPKIKSSIKQSKI